MRGAVTWGACPAAPVVQVAGLSAVAACVGAGWWWCFAWWAGVSGAALGLLSWGAIGWVSGAATPLVNCLTLALLDRLRLGRGRLRRDGAWHFRLEIGDGEALDWVPSARGGWRRRVLFSAWRPDPPRKGGRP